MYSKKEIIGRYARVIMDHWFKRTFGIESHKRLLLLFLKELIPERDIVDLTYVSSEHINPFPDKKDSRVDVECTDSDGARFLVEMQVKDQTSFYDRAVMYSTYVVQEQLPKTSTMDYSFPTVYFIGLMDFSRHIDTDQVKFKYLIKREDADEVMTDHLQYIFLELPNCHKALTPEASVLDNVCYALHNMEHLTDRPKELKEEIFKLLFEYAEIRTFTAEEKVKYEQDMTTERDLRNQMTFAENKARAEGKAEASKEIAKKMLADRMKVSIVSKYSGLSVEELQEL